MQVINSCRVLFEKHRVALLIRKFATFYEPRRYIVVFTTASGLYVELGFDVVNINLSNVCFNVISYGRRATLMIPYFMLKKANNERQAMYV
jgi:hypothetical protein